MDVALQYFSEYLVPASIATSSLILGFLLDRGIYVFFRKVTLRTEWKWDDIVVTSLKGKVKYIVILIGLGAALQTISINKEITVHISRALVVAGVFVVTIVTASATSAILREYNRRGDEVRPVISIFSTLTKGIVFFLGFLIMLQYLGISITPMLTALGVTGLAVALALQETLSNIFAGIHIIATKQIMVGNYIELDGGIEGYVRDITWRNATVETIRSNMVIIPNSKLASSVITNYSLPLGELTVLVQVGVSYDSDLRFVEKVTMETAKEVMQEIPGGVHDFKPFMRYHTFDDFSINFTVILRARTFIDKYLVKHEFVKRLHERYKKEGITIPFPIRTVYMEKDQEQ